MTRRVIFLCWGNICRSPMAAMMARAEAPQALSDVEFSSAGVSSEERGNPIDPRAAAVLREHGIAVGAHRAHRITPEEAEAADLVVAMTPDHIRRLHQVAPGARAALLTSFDPDATSDAVVDPWYGSDEGFEDTYASIAAALPGLFDALR